MSEEEVSIAIDEIVSSGLADFGAVMGKAMGSLKGKADGGMVSRIVKEKLS